VSWERPRVARGSAACALAVAAAFCWSCGSLSDPPTQPPEPTQTSTPAPAPAPSPSATPVLGGPAPKPTPAPEASPSPSPGPTPGTGNEGTTACGSPTPPDLSRITINVHLRSNDWWLLDSTPLVGPDWEYCAAIGFTDGRSYCAVRPEGNPQRSPCELVVTGRASDTGKPGPTWRRDGTLCTGRASGCDNVPENQFQLLVYASGTYTACGNKNGVCGEIEVDK